MYQILQRLNENSVLTSLVLVKKGYPQTAVDQAGCVKMLNWKYCEKNISQSQVIV